MTVSSDRVLFRKIAETASRMALKRSAMAYPRAGAPCAAEREGSRHVIFEKSDKSANRTSVATATIATTAASASATRSEVEMASAVNFGIKNQPAARPSVAKIVTV